MPAMPLLTPFRMLPVAALFAAAAAVTSGCPANFIGVPADGGQDAGVLADAGIDAGRVIDDDDAGDGNDEDAGETLDGGAVDGGAPPDGGPPVEPRCVRDGNVLECDYETYFVGTLLGPRSVHVALPSTPPPEGGYPVALFFQGSFFPGEAAFWGVDNGAFGQDHLVATVQALLDSGFAVVAPDALAGGTTFWQTNIAPFALFWEGSADDLFMRGLFADLEEERFGPTDATRLFAMGISSGGFMTSRMAVSYPERFLALAVHSGSYATCGAVCFVPEMPQTHPPTLFMHGEDDLVVHPPMMRLYRDALDDAGFETETFVVEGGHAWLAPSAQEIPRFFRENLP